MSTGYVILLRYYSCGGCCGSYYMRNSLERTIGSAEQAAKTIYRKLKSRRNTLNEKK